MHIYERSPLLFLYLFPDTAPLRKTHHGLIQLVPHQGPAPVGNACGHPSKVSCRERTRKGGDSGAVTAYPDGFPHGLLPSETVLQAGQCQRKGVHRLGIRTASRFHPFDGLPIDQHRLFPHLRCMWKDILQLINLFTVHDAALLSQPHSVLLQQDVREDVPLHALGHQLSRMYARTCDRHVDAVVHLHGEVYLMAVPAVGGQKNGVCGSLRALLRLRVPSEGTYDRAGEFYGLKRTGGIESRDGRGNGHGIRAYQMRIGHLRYPSAQVLLRVLSIIHQPAGHGDGEAAVVRRTGMVVLYTIPGVSPRGGEELESFSGEIHLPVGCSEDITCNSSQHRRVL